MVVAGGQADEDVRQMHARLLTAQTDRATAQAFADWKKKIRASFMAADYRWSDESPFVCIPKVVLPELCEFFCKGSSSKPGANDPISPPGVVNPSVRDLLSLTPAERQAIEEMLQRVAELQRGEKADVYEMEKPVSGRTVAARLFAADPLGKVGPEAEQRFAQMLTDLRDILGEERWPVLPSRFTTVNCDVLNRMLIPQRASHISASVEVEEKGIPRAKWTLTGEATPVGGVKQPPARDVKPSADGRVYSLNVVGYVNNNAALSAFLPDADPEQRNRATNFGGINLPPAVKQRAAAWFEEQAVAWSAGKEKP